MNLYSKVRELLRVDPAVDQNRTGPIYTVIPEAEGDAGTFRVFIDITQDGGLTAPKVNVVVETSYDGIHWVSVATLQTTGDGSASDFVAITALGPKVRAKTVLEGATPPVHTAIVTLASTANFRLQ